MGKPFMRRLESILLLGLGLMIFKLYVSGHVTELIAPKMVPYALVALVSFFLLSFIRIKKQRESIHHCACETKQESSSSSKVLKYGLFLIPILLGFILTDFTLSGDVLAKRGMVQQQNSFMHSYGTGTHVNGEKIIVTDDNYFEVLNDLMNNLDTIVGKEIEISGFVYREKGFTENQMAIARLSMSCCVVDASLYGYMVHGNVENMKTNAWYSVTGTLKKGTYQGEPMPMIDLKKKKEIKPPEETYLYESIQIVE